MLFRNIFLFFINMVLCEVLNIYDPVHDSVTESRKIFATRPFNKRPTDK